jgi:sigma-54 dependent transcriptional regulator, acetoin dehydrogenase operon transcriptional activator AcoR
MDHLGTADFAMMVTDSQGYVAGRWVSDRALSDLLDTMGSVVGAHFDESMVGSTGLGTVLEDRTTAIVDGAEHFNRRFDPVIAVGAPIIHPATGCVEGVLDLVCPTGVRPEMMVALIERAAREVGERLLSGFAAQDRALLDAFLQLERRGPHRPVLAINRRMVLANSSGGALVGSYPHDTLWRNVEQALACGQTSLVLSGDTASPIQAHLRGISGTNVGEGALLQLGAVHQHSLARSPTGAERITTDVVARLAGRSLLWRTAVQAAVQAAVSGGRLLLWGRTGCGKTALAEALIASMKAAAVEDEIPVEAELLDDISVASRAELRALRARLDESAQPIVVATVEASSVGDLPDRLLGEFEHVVAVPDLARRPEDIAHIAARLVDQLTDGTSSLTPDAALALTQRSWRGNARQLHRVLMAAVAHAPGSRIHASDLPTEPEAAPPLKRLTYLENVEREAIAALLASTGGNKRKVAEILGLSRSTLYRKLTALQLD